MAVIVCKYVSSPPISIRRIECYNGQKVTYRYEDHRKGEVHETITAVEFIGRMIRHLPPKNFRMVRYYGIYARPVREKIHELVAGALRVLVERAEAVARYFAKKSHCVAAGYGQKIAEQFGKGLMRCPECGSTKMLLVRIWSKTAGVLYDLLKE